MEPKTQTLTDRAILYISSGFIGPYTLQVIACRPITTHIYQVCLTDGQLYIGGKYVSQKPLQVQPYGLVQIQCRFTSRFQPIQITSLKVISNSTKCLIGKPPTTLHDYFQHKQLTNEFNGSTSQRSQSSHQFAQKTYEQSKKSKRLKSMAQKQITNASNQSDRIFTETQKIRPSVSKQIQIIHNAQTQQHLNVNLIQNLKSGSQESENILSARNQQTSQYASQQQPCQIPKGNLNLSEQSEQVAIVDSKTQRKVYFAQQQETKPVFKKNETHNAYISQLYERMPRWKILARVMSIRTFISSKGKKCSIMFLIDQKGNSIKAIYYYSKDEKNPADILVEGLIYSFSGGQVIKPNCQQQQSANLQIILDCKCQITEYDQIFIYPFSVKTLTKFKDLLNLRQQVNLIGILKQVQILAPNSYKSKPKIKGIICHPQQLYQIQFHKILYGGEKQLVLDSIYVFYNFMIIQVQNAIKLTGSNNSFIVRINQEDVDYNKAANYPEFFELRKFKQISSNTWKKYSYHNLSEVKYSKRNISEMKKVINEIDSIFYSEILVSIADIKLKKEYMACPFCKKSTIQQEKTIFQCIKCKKIVNPSPAIIVNLILADATGSFNIDVFGEKVKIFIGVDTSQFMGLSQEEKQCTLQISKFSQFVVRIKTERKSSKEFVHSLQNVDKQEHTLSMKQIRRRTVEQKLKLQPKWDQYE